MAEQPSNLPQQVFLQCFCGVSAEAAACPRCRRGLTFATQTRIYVSIALNMPTELKRCRLPFEFMIESAARYRTFVPQYAPTAKEDTACRVGAVVIVSTAEEQRWWDDVDT